MSFEVIVRDNYHYMDPDETYTIDGFATWEDALAKAQSLVEISLQESFVPGITASALFLQYTMFGDDPFIHPVPEGKVSFSAWDYARQRCEEICREKYSGRQGRAAGRAHYRILRLAGRNPLPAGVVREVFCRGSQMDAWDQVAEKRILEAIEKGEFDHLEGAGKPLELDDTSMVPPELRMAYRILKNAGFAPPELEARKEMKEVEDLLMNMEEGAERDKALARFNYLSAKLSLARKGGSNLRLEQQYFEKIIRKLDHEE